MNNLDGNIGRKALPVQKRFRANYFSAK